MTNRSEDILSKDVTSYKTTWLKNVMVLLLLGSEKYNKIVDVVCVYFNVNPSI